jgi:hypothetical protein
MDAQHRRADLDLVAVCELDLRTDRLPVHERAVGGAEVLDRDLPPEGAHRGVAAGDARIVEDEVDGAAFAA